MRLIPLSKGQFAKVSDHRYKHLMQWTWHAAWNKKTQSFYACRNQNVNPEKKPWINQQVRMHRYILGLTYKDGIQGEHKDGDTLNNQDRNLRKANNSNNAMNRKRLMANNTSGFKGVYRLKHHKSKSFAAFVKVEGKMIFLGNHTTFEEAVAARRAGEKKYYREFARPE